ncbi:MAG TPA: elongation factor P maturation arginine rhamnosyltransferase EarP [Moraxellaceae bacterium]|nr:elongation factor P maturation arginine rhamnosyltransferase EarP [Moraxellaceae bacterium]
MTTRCDIFCTIIDNFGDIGVCWRLSRQLAAEHGLDVSLWVDDLATFARLAPALNPALATQRLDDITVRHWADPVEAPDPGDLVIEGFGCRLPSSFLQAMRARATPPVWINLEYLSAEAWVEDCHGLASVHPATGLTQHFWFPGFTERTGGLLRETGLLAARNHLQADATAQAAFWTRIGVPEALACAQRVSLFAYENPAIPGLLTALADAGSPWLILVPEGRALGNVQDWVGRSLHAGERVQRGALTVVVLPLLATDDYDRLLAGCSLNAVRGEDSLVRAHWAGAPLLWHIYPQEEDAHWVKLSAWITRVEAATAMPALWAEAQRAWNRGDASPALWRALVADLPALSGPARAWSDRLAAQPDLAAKLMHFWRGQVE